jgi:hypothetical protein
MIEAQDIQTTIDAETAEAKGGSVRRLVLPVAVLCVAPKSIYRTLPNVECYDITRDVRTFTGGMPVVAHPPCRSWSAYCAHQAKPLPGEKELGPLCVEWLRKCGGVLEHPAHSRLFDACKLPKPGWARGDLWSVEVLQAWWGDSRTKKTWLCFAGISPNDVQLPLRLHDPSGDRRRWQVMSHTQRSATNPNMAVWLVETARMVGQNH